MSICLLLTLIFYIFDENGCSIIPYFIDLLPDNFTFIFSSSASTGAVGIIQGNDSFVVLISFYSNIMLPHSFSFRSERKKSGKGVLKYA